MKKIFKISFISLISIFILVFFISINFVKADITIGENLLNDPSFEENGCDQFQNVKNKSTNWTQVSWANVDKGLGFARTGQNQAFMTFSWTGLGVGEYPTLYQDVDIEADTYYEFSFYAKRYGDAESVPLIVGIRDIYKNDPWANIDETIVSNVVSEEYEKVSCIFYSGTYTELRFAIYLCAIDYEGKDGGYHIDDMALYKISPMVSGDIEIDSSVEIGKPLNYNASISLENGSVITSNESSSVKAYFESSDESIICTNISGTAVPLKEGTCKLKSYVSFCGKQIEIGEKEITITSDAIPDKTYIKSISLSMPDELIFTDYSEIYYSLVTSDESLLNTDELEISVESTDKSVCFVECVGKKIQAIGVSGGSAKIYVTINYNDLCCIATLNVNVKATNYLKDPSFECYEKNSMWVVESNCGVGIDSGLLNGLSHSGYSNFWMMAPVYWEPSCLNTSSVLIYQTVYLTPGEYELSAYINRFYATGVDGVLAGIGGNVKIGAIRLDDNYKELEDDQYSEFDVSYGFGGFQRLSTLIKVEEAANYKVYYRVDGDESFGLGMQLDDMYLVDAVYPVSIKAYLLDDTFDVDDLAEVIVEATYEDGSTGIISSGIRFIPDDYHILYESGGFLIGRENGTTNVKIKVNILQRDYETSLTIKVGTGVKESNSNTNKKGCKKSNALDLVISFTALSSVIFLTRKRGNK